MPRRRQRIRAAVTTAACVLLGGCSGVGPFDTTREGALPDRISLSPSVFSLGAIGAQRQLAITDGDGAPVPASSQPTWGSSDSAVATVDSVGMVTAVGDGTATITAQVGTMTASAQVTVSAVLQMTVQVTALDQNDPDPSDNSVVTTITIQAR